MEIKKLKKQVKELEEKLNKHVQKIEEVVRYKKKIETILLEICKEIATEKLFENEKTHLNEKVIDLILHRKKDPYTVGSDVMKHN